MAVHTLKPRAILEWCKKPKVIATVVFAGFVSGTFVPYLVFGSGPDDPSCGRFDYSRQCDLSPTLFLLVDLVIGILLAILFHYLSNRNQKRLDQIIASQEALRNKAYGVGVFVFSNPSTLRIRIAPHVPTYLSILAGHIEFTNAERWISLAIHLQKSMSSPLGVRRHEIFIGAFVSNASAPLPLAEEAHETVH